MFLALIILSVAFILGIIVRIKYSYVFSIKSKTVHLQKPYGMVKRKLVIENEFHNDLISKEEVSRKSAYKNSTILTNDSFFDDSDMQSDYYLVIVYDKRLNIPLLTARYYYDKSTISKSLSGDNNIDTKNILNLETIQDGHIFLSDRLSGNPNSSEYRRHRQYIFLLFYVEILLRNKGKQFILMARKEKYDKLLNKYLQIGLQIIGSNTHKGKEHWILLGDVEVCEAKLKLSILTKFVLLFKKFTFNIKN